jgi:hypothetical protein
MQVVSVCMLNPRDDNKMKTSCWNKMKSETNEISFPRQFSPSLIILIHSMTLKAI